MSDAVLVTLILVVGSVVLSAMLVMVKVISNITEAMNDANERSVTHLRALTTQFAEGCLAISEPNQQVILRRIEADHPTPAQPVRFTPPVEDANDINAEIHQRIYHGGDPNS